MVHFELCAELKALGIVCVHVYVCVCVCAFVGPAGVCSVEYTVIAHVTELFNRYDDTNTNAHWLVVSVSIWDEIMGQLEALNVL